MNRRTSLKLAAMSGLGAMMPPFLRQRAAWAALPDTINYQAPAVLPTIIHVFLYGGPSELAGNLSNISEINTNSQNAYPTSLDPANSANDITPNAFWGAAGGSIMETLLASGDLSIFRTINRIKSNSNAHNTCVTQNLVGGLDTTAPVSQPRWRPSWSDSTPLENPSISWSCPSSHSKVKAKYLTSAI